MNRVFKPYLDKFVLVFIDDILVYSRLNEEHAERLRIVLKTLEEHKLYAKFKKCDFWMEKVHFLGHVIFKEGLLLIQLRLRLLLISPDLQILQKHRAFLGMAGYFRRFVEGFSKIALPLTKLLRKDNKFVWTEECKPSFQECKQRLVSAPALTISEGFVVYSDKSRQGLGCVFMQKDQVVAYAS